MEYNKETKTLSIPYNFDEELKDIPEETENIIFTPHNLISDNVADNFPKNLSQITFGDTFNKKVDYLWGITYIF